MVTPSPPTPTDKRGRGLLEALDRYTYRPGNKGGRGLRGNPVLLRRDRAGDRLKGKEDGLTLTDIDKVVQWLPGIDDLR